MRHRLARIILHGVTGPITVEGQTWNLDMPGLAKLSDTEISDVMTYVRRSWDHGASAVTPAEVKAVRVTTRPTPWTERELLKSPEFQQFPRRRAQSGNFVALQPVSARATYAFGHPA